MGAKSEPVGGGNRIMGLRVYVVVMTIFGLGHIDSDVVVMTLWCGAQAGSLADASYWILGAKKTSVDVFRL